MPFRIKVRLTEMNRSQASLIPILKTKYDLKVDPAELSKILKGILQNPKADKVLSAANEIVTEWEHEARRIS